MKYISANQTILFAILCLCLSFTSSAQSTGKISGMVLGSDQKALANVSVSLLKAQDSSLVKLAITDKDGLYEFTNISYGNYLLSFTTIGFQKQYSTPFSLTNGQAVVPDINLVPDAKALAGVTVQSRRPLVEHKIDRMVVNVDASPTNAGASALEVLEKSPGITVDRDGNISIKGKQGVIVLIDGKQTHLSGQELANLLRNMPSSELDQVEIMTQPSAKYDASGNSGILNLKTKKSLSRGFNGTINLLMCRAAMRKHLTASHLITATAGSVFLPTLVIHTGRISMTSTLPGSFVKMVY